MGSAEIDTEATASVRSRRRVHPSAPIPVQGAPLGDSIRLPLGESGLDVFPLVLGTAEFGWRVDLSVAQRILDAYREAGGNAIHTSDAFASGRSEHFVGQWMHTRAIRDEVSLAVRIGAHPDHPGLGSTNLVRAVESSLTRLGTDYIDLLMLDPVTDRQTSLEDTLATVGWLTETGKVRAVGAYGLTAAQFVEARILAAAGYPRLTVADAPYNVLRQHEVERDLRLVLGAQGIAVLASQALEHGYLAGVHRTRSRIGPSVRGSQLVATMTRRGTKTLRALDAVAADLSISTAAVAIAWLLAQRFVTAATVNLGDPAEVQSLVQGIGAELSRAHMADIARAAG